MVDGSFCARGVHFLGGETMPITTTCPCGCKLKMSIALAGQLFKCPKCGHSITIPFEADPHDRHRTEERNSELDTHRVDTCTQVKDKEQLPAKVEAKTTSPILWKGLGKVLGLLRLPGRSKKLRHGHQGNPAGFVYVNQDGTVRELSPQEQDYLAQEFHPSDSARPYIKSRYKSLNGWGSMSGFLPRSKVPSGLEIDEVNPDFDSHVSEEGLEGMLETLREAGEIITRNPDGSISVTANPHLSHKQRFGNMQRAVSEHQKETECLFAITAPASR
jgi:hypothetical protein